MNNINIYPAYTTMVSKFLIDPNTNKPWNQEYLDMQKLTISNQVHDYTLADIYNEICECQQLLQAIGFNMANKNYGVAWLSNKAKRVFGRCRRMSSTQYTIFINQAYLKTGTPEHIHNTIMHEVIHSVDGCMNHGPDFKRVGAKVNKYFVFTPIQRCSTDESYREEVLVQYYKYQLVCTKCGETWNYMRCTKKLKALAQSKTASHSTNNGCRCYGPFNLVTL